MAHIPPLRLQATSSTPEINFDAATGLLSLKGRCIPDDLTAFFMPILIWLEAYSAHPNPDATQLELELDYLSSGALHMMRRTLQRLDDLPGVLIRWHYYEDDEDMLALCTDLARSVGLPIKMIPLGT